MTSPRRRMLLRRQDFQCGDSRGHAAFHVGGAASEDGAILPMRGEGVGRPAIARG